MTDAIAVPMITENTDALASIQSFDDALALLASAGVSINSTEEYGDGFKILANADKDRLVKLPFIVLGMKFPTGDHGEFVVMHIVTKSGEKWIVTDGSTGIYKQAALYAGKGKTAGLLVPDGLIRSDYKYTDNEGKETPATTYYLS